MNTNNKRHLNKHVKYTNKYVNTCVQSTFPSFNLSMFTNEDGPTIKGTFMQIEKALLNDHLQYVFQKHPENFAFQLFIIFQ